MPTSTTTTPPTSTAAKSPEFSDSHFSSQVSSGLDLINAAINARVASIDSQLGHWRSLAKSRESDVHTLSLEVKRLQSKLAEVDLHSKALLAENVQLRASKHVVHQKYIAMKKVAGRLESWRRTIIKMVEYTPTATPHPDPHITISSTSTARPTLPSHVDSSDDEGARKLSYVAGIDSNASLLMGLNASSVPSFNRSMDSSAVLENPQSTIGPSHRHSATPSTSDPNEDNKSNISTKPRPQLTAETHTSSQSSTVADAQALYKAIRKSVHPDLFSQFAQTINAFNAGTIGVSESVQRIDSIVTDPFLATQMRHLIYRAVEESSLDNTHRSSKHQDNLTTLDSTPDSPHTALHSAV